MIVSHQKEKAKLNEGNMENEIYLLEYEQHKGRMIDEDGQEMRTNIKRRNLEGNN